MILCLNRIHLHQIYVSLLIPAQDVWIGSPFAFTFSSQSHNVFNDYYSYAQCTLFKFNFGHFSMSGVYINHMLHDIGLLFQFHRSHLFEKKSMKTRSNIAAVICEFKLWFNVKTRRAQQFC